MAQDDQKVCTQRVCNTLVAGERVVLTGVAFRLFGKGELSNRLCLKNYAFPTVLWHLTLTVICARCQLRWIDVFRVCHQTTKEDNWERVLHLIRRHGA